MVKTYTEEELKKAINDITMECMRTYTFSGAALIMGDLTKRLKLNYTPYWNDFEKIRGLLEDYVGKPLYDCKDLNLIVKGLIKKANKYDKN